MSDGYETILYEVDDPVALITLNRPARLNAWTMAMGRELRDAVALAGADKRVVGIVITGAERAFCSGGDLKDLKPEDLKGALPKSSGNDAVPPHRDGGPAGPLDYLVNLPKPVIAAVNGVAVGMGAVVALWCDLRFMAEEAMISMAFSQRGTVAESGSSHLLTRLVGPAAALDLLLSSRRVKAEEALRLRLVDRTAPAADLVGLARAYVAELAASCSPTSMATIKRQIHSELNDRLTTASALSSKLLAEVVDSPDIREGWQAFLEKRPARFARIGAE